MPHKKRGGGISEVKASLRKRGRSERRKFFDKARTAVAHAKRLPGIRKGKLLAKIEGKTGGAIVNAKGPVPRPAKPKPRKTMRGALGVIKPPIPVARTQKKGGGFLKTFDKVTTAARGAIRGSGAFKAATWGAKAGLKATGVLRPRRGSARTTTAVAAVRGARTKGRARASAPKGGGFASSARKGFRAAQNRARGPQGNTKPVRPVLHMKKGGGLGSAARSVVKQARATIRKKALR